MSEPSHQNATPKKTSPRPIFHFASGLLSGVSSAVLLQPADLLKTRVQQSRTTTLRETLRNILAGPNPITSLWRGTLPSALRTGLGSAVYFTTLSSLRETLAIRKHATQTTSLSLTNGVLQTTASSVLPRLSSTENLATGAIARVLAGFILMPMTVIKVRFESDFYAYRSLLSASRDIYARNGLRGFFTGFGATAVRDAPYAGLYVVFYENSKSKLSRMISPLNEDSPKTMTSRSAALVNFSSAAFAAGLATTITNPFDAVKTRLQLLPAKYGNMFRTIKIMLKEDGVRSFFDGLGLRMARKGASSALAWTVYEELIGRAKRRLADSQRDETAGNPL